MKAIGLIFKSFQVVINVILDFPEISFPKNELGFFLNSFEYFCGYRVNQRGPKIKNNGFVEVGDVPINFLQNMNSRFSAFQTIKIINGECYLRKILRSLRRLPVKK